MNKQSRIGDNHPKATAVVFGAAAALALAIGGLALPPATASASAASETTATQIPFSGQAVPGSGSSDGSGSSSGNGYGQYGSGQGNNGAGQGGYGDFGGAGNGQFGNGGSGNGGGQFGNGGFGGSGNGGNGQLGNGSQSGTGSIDASPASAKESRGVVLIDTALGYEQAQAAGTGIVLSPDGLVLTNNHVIDGSTEVAVTVPANGKTYKATVVGSDAKHDVAVIQLKNASGLTPAALDTNGIGVGDSITAVGNAEGTGQLLAADGSVTGLNKTVTTRAEQSAASETLNGLIQLNADIVPGDSGGALLDGQGEVVGMNTAASTGTSDITGFAIPISNALTIATSIIDGQQTSTNTLGYPAFLGIGVVPSSEVSAQSGVGQNGAGQNGFGQGGYSQGQQSGQTESINGAVIAGVYENTPAADAGLQAGDIITKVGSTTISNSTQLHDAIATQKPGDSVPVTWTDANGQSHTANVTLTEGPAD